MKVEIKVLKDIKEPYAIIYTNEMTKEVSKVASILEAEATGVIPMIDNERIIVLKVNEIYMVRIEDEKTIVYTKTKRYENSKRLYEFEAILGSDFFRISKGTLINLHYLDYAEPTFGGLMLIVLKNGCKDYISRKYLPAFKKHLGL